MEERDCCVFKVFSMEEHSDFFYKRDFNEKYQLSKNLMYKLPNLIDPLIDKCSLVFLNILSIHQPTSTYVLNIFQRIPKDC